MNTRKYRLNDIQQNRFYQIPKFLFEGEFKKGLSAEAKLLYSLLKDRFELSNKNKWIDDDGFVYFYFTRKEMSDLLGWGKDKIIKLCKELKNFGIFEEVRQGLNLPNKIYLSYMDFESSQESSTEEKTAENPVAERSSEKPTSGVLKNRVQEVGKTDPNDTDNNNTNIIISYQSNLDNNIYNNINNNPDEILDTIDEINTQNETEIEKQIKENIELDFVKEEKYDSEDFVQFEENCYELITETLKTKKKYISVAKSNIPYAMVRNRFLKLTLVHIQYVYDCFEKNCNEIRNIKAYLLTSLYNAPITMESFWKNKVNHDLKGGVKNNYEAIS